MKKPKSRGAEKKGSKLKLCAHAGAEVEDRGKKKKNGITFKWTA